MNNGKNFDHRTAITIIFDYNHTEHNQAPEYDFELVWGESDIHPKAQKRISKEIESSIEFGIARLAKDGDRLFR